MGDNGLRYNPSGSYRVDDNVWAGEYPVWEWEQGARMRQLKLFTDFGIDYFLDLTEHGDMPPYAPFLPDNIGRCSFPIRNCSIPDSVRRVVDAKSTFETSWGTISITDPDVDFTER